ncbi:MAG: hypothetical protein VX246_09670 [Myxococcota bacterium]|nr:hypothetical protein [Myxococcota bacterium]
MDRSERKPQRAPGLGWGLCLGTLIYLAYGTRSTGALLLPALFGIDLLRGRFPKAPLWTAAASFSVLALLQNLFLHSESGHLFYKFSQLDLALPIHNLFVAYPELFHDFWRSQPPISALGFGVAALAAVALAAGLVQRARRRELDVLDGFVLVSLGFFLFIRLHDMNPPQRYWIPLFPLLVVQIIRGFAELPLPRRHLLLGGFSALALLGYATSYGPLEAHEVKKGITSADAREMYAYIRQHTQEDDTLIFFEPRVLTLYTGRPASELRTAGNREEWMRYAKEIGARYWIRPGGLPTDYQNTLSIVFSNETFSVFRFDAYR